MPCYNPTRVIMDGDHRLHFDKDYKHAVFLDGETVCNVPCRKCVGCNQATQREWSVRAFHEAQLHTTHWTDDGTNITTQIPNSSVLTLTYDDAHLPPNGVLRHDDFQRFIKRLRQRRQRRFNALGIAGPCPKIRYFMCGEYGGKTHRPHYHAVIFGDTFDDRYSEQSADGQVNAMSYELDELWSDKIDRDDKDCPRTKIGRATVDYFTFAGASYVAGYVAKKAHIDGHQGPTKMTTDSNGICTITPIEPEYRQMSTNPGIGAEWILKTENMLKTYESDSIRIGKWTFHPPKHYDQLLNRKRPDLVQQVKENRRSGLNKNAETWDKSRCAAAELIALKSLQQRRDSL